MNNFKFTLLFISLVSFSTFSQDCAGILRACKANLNKDNANFLSDGQVYTAFLDREKAEFKTTLVMLTSLSGSNPSFETLTRNFQIVFLNTGFAAGIFFFLLHQYL